MAGAPKPKLTHMGVYVSDLPKMVEFYTAVIGLTVTDRGKAHSAPVELVFLSNDPSLHHMVALANGRPPDASFSVVNQMSFTLETLDELRAMHQRLVAADVDGLRLMNHGVSWSVYCKDPEGNIIEMYVDSPWYVPQPRAYPFDLSLPRGDIMRATEALCRADPGFMSREAWQAEIAATMTAGG